LITGVWWKWSGPVKSGVGTGVRRNAFCMEPDFHRSATGVWWTFFLVYFACDFGKIPVKVRWFTRNSTGIPARLMEECKVLVEQPIPRIVLIELLVTVKRLRGTRWLKHQNKT
jgi:hypothetical protein